MRKLAMIMAVAGMILAVSGTAQAEDAPNTVASSTMVFQGTLANPSTGVYTGTLWMINEDTLGLGDGIAGFDVYAKNGAWATYQVGDSGGSGPDGEYTEGLVADHDAYKTGGGWGATYDPDCADWYNYQVRLTADHWYVEYNAQVGNDHDTSGASCNPMSGAMDWSTSFASEDDTGAYYSGSGAKHPGYAATFATSKGQSTVGAWDMDWGWGSDYVPLQYSGFDVTVDYVDGGTSTVTLTPVPEPATLSLLALGGLALIRRKRRRV